MEEARVAEENGPCQAKAKLDRLSYYQLLHARTIVGLQSSTSCCSGEAH